MSTMLSLIIVTHNSEVQITRCIDGIDRQSVAPDQVIIVDSGSDDPSYLSLYQHKAGYEVYLKENIGFAAGNNFGLRFVAKEVRFIFFINPDTYLEAGNIASALEVLSREHEAAMVSGRLKGFDLNSGAATGLLDSTGIFRTWYGRWYDRGQGQEDTDNFLEKQEVPAICGAFMFCRAAALENDRPALFDESFFMYKEDIDLCLRLRGRGWKLLYEPTMEAFHGRGWSNDRKMIPHEIRCLASKNEIRLNLKHRSPYLIWALFKYVLVSVLHV